MNHLKTFLLTIDDDAFQLEDDSFLLLGSTILSKLLSPFNRVIIPFRDPINRSLILFVPSLAPFTPSPTPSPARGEGYREGNKRDYTLTNTLT